MNYAKFLFEAPIDAWLKKNKELSQDEKLKAEIIFKDLQSKYTEHLHQNAKNLVALDFQTLNLLYSAILEAIKQNLSPTTVQWLTKEVVDGKAISLENIMEDYIPPLRVYQNNKEKLPALDTIPDIISLNNILNENLEPEQKQLVNESDFGKIAEMDGWNLYMPHTTAASCELGMTGGKRDTTWCTTRTEGQNLYLQYVGRFDKSYTLFYVIKRGVNASKNPFIKMSIGTAGNQILFNQGDNSISVNADNKNLTEEKFRQVVGDKIADFFLEKIKEIIGEPEFKHPMKAEMERLARDPKLFLKKLNTYGDSANDQESKRDLIREILKYESVHPEIIILLAEDENSNVRRAVAENEKTPPKILRLLAKDEIKFVRQYVARNPNTPPEALLLLAKDEDEYVRETVTRNPNISPEALLLLAEDKDAYVRETVARNTNIPPEALLLLAEDENMFVRRAVANNKKTPPEALLLLAEDKDLIIREAVARNPNTPLEALMLLAKDTNPNVRKAVIFNPNITPEFSQKLKIELGLNESRKSIKISLSSIIFKN